DHRLVALARAALAAVGRPAARSDLAARVHLDRRVPHPLPGKLSCATFASRSSCSVWRCSLRWSPRTIQRLCSRRSRICTGGSALLYAMLWFLVIEAIVLGLFVLVQTRGMLGWTWRLLERVGIRPARVQGMLGRVDDSLGQFYRTAPGRLGLSIGFHFVAWL